MGTRKKECSSLVSDVLRICSHRNWLLRKMQMSGESAVLNRFLMWALLYWNKNVHILSWAISPLGKLKWAPPGVSAGPQFLDKLIVFSGWLIFITNALDEINTNTLEEQATLHRAPADKAMPWQSTASCQIYSSSTGSTGGAEPSPLLLTPSASTQQCQGWGLCPNLGQSSLCKDASKREGRNKWA